MEKAQEDVKQQSVSLLLLGQTGAGKSTFVNALFNFAKGTLLDGPKAFIIKPSKDTQVTESQYKMYEQNEDYSKVGQSLTKGAMPYSFPDKHFRISVIDTPGLGDTRGEEADKANVESIIEGIKRVALFNAICLICKVSDTREQSGLKYYIRCIKEMLTKDICDNFIVCLTYAPEEVDETVSSTLTILQGLDIPVKI